MKKFISLNGLWIFMLLCICYLVVLPLLHPGLIVTDDGNWMVIRLSAFYQSLTDGQFPVRFLGRLNYSFGYPVANFLYPGFMYIGSVLHFLGLTFQSTIEVIIIGSLVLGSIGTYLWLRTYFSQVSSFFGSLVYLLNPYLLYDVYTRGSVGEILVIGLISWVLYFAQTNNKVAFIPLLALMLISHNTAALFCFLLLAIILYLKRAYTFVKPVGIAIGFSAFFWIPALVEKRFVLFDTVEVSNPHNYFLPSMELLVKNAPLALLAVVLLFLHTKNQQKEKTYFSWIILLGVFFISQLSSIFWNTSILKLFVQFPFRLFIFWIIPGAWIIAYMSDSYKKLGMILALISIAWMGYGSIEYLNAESIVREDGYFSTNEGTTTVANEYMPRWASVLPSKRVDERIEITSGNAKILPIEINSNRIHVKAIAKEDSVLQINTLFYPGWGALVDNKPVTISYNNDLGVMRLPILTGEHTIFLEFRETKSRFLADVVTLVSLFLYLGIYLIPIGFRRFFQK